VKTPKRWWQILAWLRKGIITPEEGCFLLEQELKKAAFGLYKKGYSWR
jgi:hypothetical protein